MVSALFLRRPHSSYQRVVQGKCPLHFLNLNGVVCSNTLFSNTSALTSSQLFKGNSTCKILEHLVWSNTSGFRFLGPLARTNILSALCGLPIFTLKKSRADKGTRTQTFWSGYLPVGSGFFHVKGGAKKLGMSFKTQGNQCF